MVDEPDKLKEAEFRILKALAAVQDVGDFRLREIMSQLGFEPGRSILFYRALVQEAREIFSLIDTFEENIDVDFKVNRQLKITVAQQRQKINNLIVKLRNLEGQTHQKTESISKERSQLAADSAKVLGYDALTQLLMGESKPQTLKLISDMYFDMYTEALNAIIYKRPLPDPGRLDKLRQELAEELRDLLRIPPEQLEKEMDALRAENEELKKNNQAMAAVKWVEYQRGLMVKSPEEPEENSEVIIQKNFMEYLESLAAKRRNKSNETEPGGD